jgi:hypothetical protein
MSMKLRSPSRYFLAPVIGGLALMGAVASVSANAEDKKQRESEAPAAKTIGDPQTCIPLRNIRRTEVHDDYTIDFVMQGGRTYRNNLRARCPGLAFEEAFSYSTSINRLCRSDIITVLSQGGPGLFPRASCGLGRFQEIELIEDDADDS